MIVLAKFFKNYEKNIDNIIILLGIIISLKSFLFSIPYILLAFFDNSLFF